MENGIWFESYGRYYRNLYKVYSILKVIPSSSSYIERSFSIQSYIQNTRRSKLKLELINGMMRLKLSAMSTKYLDDNEDDEGDEEESDYELFL